MIEGLVVREFSPVSSNWRSTEVADEYLERNGIPVIGEIDTRAVVRHLRANGVMRGVIASGENSGCCGAGGEGAGDQEDGWDGPGFGGERRRRLMSGARVRPGIRREISGCRPLQRGSIEKHVVAYDFGIKENILRMLTREGCRVTVVPARTPSAAEVLAMQPDGVFFSNGPGDPEPLDYAIANVRELKGKTPLFGICLGHQIFGLALGGKTYKLKFGHHGGNHPIHEPRDGEG